jgi:NADPH-dependent glutamate synthase beta subunit-like oxidoreductase
VVIKIIDYSRCISCSYPVNNELNIFNLDLDEAIIKKQFKSPCEAACPAGNNIPAVIYLVKQKRLKEACQLLRDNLAIPAITGHVCYHPCESQCRRKQVDEAVNINSLERYIADQCLDEQVKPITNTYKEKIAIIGSGPAGLAASYNLTQMGYPVTIFESMPKPGGMLRYGIPEYRLPRDILDEQLNHIRGIGVEFLTGITIGKEVAIRDLKNMGYKAILTAIGTQSSLKLNIPGEELPGVIGGLEFLKNINSGKKITPGKKVVVIGGGNVALDAARTASRLVSGDITIVYRRSEREMPAHRENIREARDEGIHFVFSTAPVRIVAQKDRANAVVCIKTVSEKSTGVTKGKLLNVQGSEFAIEAEVVIVAIGETPDLTYWDNQYRFSSNGTVQLISGQNKTVKGMFACGDVVSGPSSVVEAIASGKKAAVSIDCYLRGKRVKLPDIEVVGAMSTSQKAAVEKKVREQTPHISVGERQGNFKEIKMKFTEEMTNRESERCMICGVRGNCTEVCPMDVLRMDNFLHKPVIRYPEDCMTCFNCERTCPMNAIEVDPIHHKILPVIEYSRSTNNE